MLPIPFYKPSIGEEEIEEVVDTLRNGWLTTGPKVKQFEAEFASYLGHSHAIAVNSCTAALHLALEAIGLKQGQAVLVPTMTFAATAEVVRYFGAIPLLVDCRLDDLNLDVTHARTQILAARRRGEQVVAIIPVHYGGQIGDVPGVRALAREFGLRIIEDAAHCCPAWFRESETEAWKSVGESAEISCYSFYANKTITTGEGGMACTRSPEHADRMRLMSLHGISQDAWKRYSAEGSWFYEITAPGFKYNLTDIAAAIGLHQLRKADRLHQRRTERAQRYSEQLRDVDELILPRVSPNRIHSWHLYSVRIRNGRNSGIRAHILSELKRQGIGASVHWMPLHLHPYYQQVLSYEPSDCPCAASIYPELMSLPLYPDLQPQDLDRVCDTLKQAIAQERPVVQGVQIPAAKLSPATQVLKAEPDESRPHVGSNAAFKRSYDIFFAALGLVLLSPVFLLIALAVKLTTAGTVFYRQKRIGQHGFAFVIWKFRTMVAGSDKMGPQVTSADDRRITPIGRVLRRTKLDELPQLWNVLRGDMSLVGPRPEVACYVERYTPRQKEILRHKPGITDLASLRFRDEEKLLQSVGAPEQFYVEQCLPRKLELNQEYARNANLLTDTWIILQTICPYWIGVLGVYAAILTLSFYCAAALVGSASLSWRQLSGALPLVLGLQLACLLWRRQCKGLLCYFGLPELWQITIGLFEASIVLLALRLFSRSAVPPLNLLLVNLGTSLLFLSGFRVVLRLWRERAEGKQAVPAGPQMRVGIIGAGSLGAQLARSLNTQKNLGRTAVAFFDDDLGKWHKHIHEIPVVGMPECLLQGWSEKLDEVAIALPNVSPARLHQLQRLFKRTKLKVYTLQWPLPAFVNGEKATTGAA
jgi:perosamine synthetase